VVYESRLELARITLADFDPAVTGMAAQPFLLAGGDRRLSCRLVSQKPLVVASHGQCRSL
jgi:hypothetical protein